jgi:hypothetical protein
MAVANSENPAANIERMKSLLASADAAHAGYASVR